MNSIVIFLALIQPSAFGLELPAPAPYSTILERCFGEKRTRGSAVYMGSEVKKPGIYKLKKGMTAAELVRLAGGLKRASTEYLLPKVIVIFRPTEEDPDPTHPIHRCALDWKLPEAGADACRFRLKRDDLVISSFQPSIWDYPK